MKFEELKIGMSYKLSKAFSRNEVLLFSELSLDNNPVHIDKEYGKNSRFKENIVHGFLSGSLFSAIIGTKLPGEGSIYMSQEMNFRRPIYIDQEITSIVTIIEINSTKRTVLLTTTCVDTEDNILIEGFAKVKIL